MWIRSQNRKTLCNAEIISIFEGTNDFKIYGDGSHFEDTILGTYPTEARALEVLGGIERAIINGVNVLELPKE